MINYYNTNMLSEDMERKEFAEKILAKLKEDQRRQKNLDDEKKKKTI